ncbi:ABC transporter substrate-binding protein [Agrococcus baldri]|uniref:ABC transporter substrate-binding protein n=1 Tax=Agrococcus baldri TaxID=153730 RepID=UPI001160CF95|nr:ABC transporter substrate-binding protein [Agrococcus baldri]
MTPADGTTDVFTIRLAPHADDAAREPELLALARGFIITGRRSARFLWHSRSAWHAVHLTRATTTDEPTASVAVAPATLPRGITTREAQVLTLVALGLTNGEIAGRLGTRPRTVSTQVERLLSKLGQGSRSGLAAMAVDASLIVLPLPGGNVLSTSITQAEIQHAAATLHRRWDAGADAAVSFPEHRPIVLGTIAPLLGAGASDALELVRGASIAVREINERGGIDGRLVEHRIEEVDLFDAGSVERAVERLIAEDADGITTSYVTAEQPAMIDRIAQHGCPLLHTASLESLAQLVRDDPERYGNVFQTCPTEVHYRRGFAAFLETLVDDGSWRPEGRRVVAVEADTPSSTLADSELAVQLTEIGWELSERIRVPVRDADWRGVHDAIRQLEPDAVLITHFLPDVALLQRCLAQSGYEGLVYYVYAAAIPHFQALAGDAAEGIVWSTVTGRYEDAMGERFQRQFMLRYGEAPGWSQASAAYDQVRLLADAWTTNGTTDRAATAEHLRSTIIRGLNGVYYLGAPGQTALCFPYETEDSSIGQALLIHQVQEGALVTLAPAPKGDVRRFRAPSIIAATSVR